MRQRRKNRLPPLGSIIKKRLIEISKTQKELAIEIGTSEKYLYLILYGYRSGDKYISDMERALGISLEAYKKLA